MSKNSRNPNSAPVTDDRFPINDPRLLEEIGGATRWVDYRANYWHLRLNEKARDKIRELNGTDLLDKLLKSVRFRTDRDPPPKDAIPRAFSLDLEVLWRKFQGQSLIGVRGPTLEETALKKPPSAAQKRKDWLDRVTEKPVEKVMATVPTVPARKLSAKEYLARLKAEEKQRRVEQAKQRGPITYRCHECKTTWDQVNDGPPHNCPKCKRGTTRSAVSKKEVK